MRRAVVVVVLVLGNLAIPPLALGGHGPRSVHADFDGDGFDDLAVAARLEDLTGADTQEGAVHVLYGSQLGLSSAGEQFWHQDVGGIPDQPDPQDWFGFALTTGDFDNDGYADLAIGVPFETDASYPGGVVHILHGSDQGLTADGTQFWHENVIGVAGTSDGGDSFGRSLAAGDFDRDGFSDLVVGNPSDDVAGVSAAGSIHALYGSPQGLSTEGDRLFHQNTPGVADRAEENDEFGHFLTAGNFGRGGNGDLAVGHPLEDLGPGGLNEGAVHVLYGARSGLIARGDQYWHEDRRVIRGSAAPGEIFGQALVAGAFGRTPQADLAIGTNARVGGEPGAGLVHVLYGSRRGLTARSDQVWHQDSPGIAGHPDQGDNFGGGLHAADFGRTPYADLAVAAPLETVSSTPSSGAVHVLYGTERGLGAKNDQFWHQDSPGITDEAEAFEFFGWTMATLDANRDGRWELAVGVLGEAVSGMDGAGAAHVLQGSGRGLTELGEQFWTQDSPGVSDAAEAQDQFGHFGPFFD
jgi:FG-GAP repeat protein